MAKLAVIGDTHLDRSLFGYDLSDKIYKTLNEFFELCKKNKVGRAVHLGDFFDTPRPSQEHLGLLISWCRLFESEGIYLDILVGNHEVVSGSTISSALEIVKTVGFKYVRVVDQCRTTNCPVMGHKILYLPFPSPHLYPTPKSYESHIESVFKGLGEGKVTVFSHLNLQNVFYNQQEWVYRGKDYFIPSYIMQDPRVDKIYSGHIHYHQIVDNLIVVGAANKLRMSEKDNPTLFFLDGEPVKSRTPINLIQTDIVASSQSELDNFMEEDNNNYKSSVVKINPTSRSRDAVNWSVLVDKLYSLGADHVKMLPVKIIEVIEASELSVEVKSKSNDDRFLEWLYLSKDLTTEDKERIYLKFKKLLDNNV